MLEQDRLVKSLTKDGFDLVNVKFFQGDDRTVTQEEFCKEAANVQQQIAMGIVKKTSSIDGDIEKVSLKTFLK